MTTENTITVVRRDYWAGTDKYPPYSNVAHDENDERFTGPWMGLSDQLLKGMPDGAVVEITARVVGQVPGKWRLTKPHVYERCDE